jgi:hypothetical protein
MLEKKSQAINELFWNKQIIPKPAPPPPSSTAPSQGEEEKGSASHTAPPPSVTDDGDELQETEPLAVILVNSMFHLLFLPGPSLPSPYL